MIRAWGNNIRAIPAYEKKNIAAELESQLNLLNEMNVIQRMNDLYAPAQLRIQEILQIAVDNVTEQSLQPLVNTYLLPTIAKTCPNISSAEPVYLLTATKLITEALKNLDFTNQKSLSGKIDELSYIEQAAAMNNGRHIKNPPRIPIFTVLCELNSSMIGYIKSNRLFSTSQNYELLYKLSVILSLSLIHI